jgi:CopG family transcriptional regulator, nickel-responsive regulator
MQRFTISLDDHLAHHFDEMIESKGYVNRSEAVRDLIRERIDRNQLQATQGGACVASVSYVYDRHEHTVLQRVLALQHDHHDLVITSLHTHLDHAHCLETVVLRGEMSAVQNCAQELVALRGVRHGNIHLVPLVASGDRHSHTHMPHGQHTHFEPLS